jgi:hypothetical protein
MKKVLILNRRDAEFAEFFKDFSAFHLHLRTVQVSATLR